MQSDSQRFTEPTERLITRRLLLRTWRPADEPLMAAINRDPDVTQYLNRPVDDEAVQTFFGVVDQHWQEHGFGFWAVELRQAGGGGPFVGFVGVAYPSFLPEVADRPELGWRLARDAWGQGLATEAATAARDDAFSRMGLDEVVSIIHPENARSRRLATKLGMSIERRVHNPVLARDRDELPWLLTAAVHIDVEDAALDELDRA